MITLDQLRSGDRAEIVSLDGPDHLVQRLLEFGVMENEQVEMIGSAPLGDPLEIRVGGSRLSLRRAEAASIRVRPL